MFAFLFALSLSLSLSFNAIQLFLFEEIKFDCLEATSNKILPSTQKCRKRKFIACQTENIPELQPSTKNPIDKAKKMSLILLRTTALLLRLSSSSKWHEIKCFKYKFSSYFFVGMHDVTVAQKFQRPDGWHCLILFEYKAKLLLLLELLLCFLFSLASCQPSKTHCVSASSVKGRKRTVFTSLLHFDWQQQQQQLQFKNLHGWIINRIASCKKGDFVR